MNCFRILMTAGLALSFVGCGVDKLTEDQKKELGQTLNSASRGVRAAQKAGPTTKTTSKGDGLLQSTHPLASLLKASPAMKLFTQESVADSEVSKNSSDESVNLMSDELDAASCDISPIH